MRRAGGRAASEPRHDEPGHFGKPRFESPGSEPPPTPAGPQVVVRRNVAAHVRQVTLLPFRRGFCRKAALPPATFCEPPGTGSAGMLDLHSSTTCHAEGAVPAPAFRRSPPCLSAFSPVTKPSPRPRCTRVSAPPTPIPARRPPRSLEYLLEHKEREGGRTRPGAPTRRRPTRKPALGTCFAGRRSIVCMKHVGLNVAADPFVNSALVSMHGGGFVVAVADDPGMHSSQNEQDSRWYADFARVPPSSSPRRSRRRTT